jgi:hypothetical protein
MRLQRSLCDKFQRIKQEGRGRYLELEGRPKDMRGRGPSDRQPRSPAFEGVQLYEPAAREGGGRGRGGGVQDGRCAAKRIYVLPLGTRQ